MTNGKVLVGANLDRGKAQRLKEIAQSEGVTISDLIIRWSDGLLEPHKAPPLSLGQRIAFIERKLSELINLQVRQTEATHSWVRAIDEKQAARLSELLARVLQFAEASNETDRAVLESHKAALEQAQRISSEIVSLKTSHDAMFQAIIRLSQLSGEKQR